VSRVIKHCAVCGGTTFVSEAVIWDELAQEWNLSAEQRAYVNRQQGTRCERCGCSLRSIALAKCITTVTSKGQTFLRWLWSPRTWCQRVLEINGAGDLARWLHRLPLHVSASYPQVDMQQMTFADGSFDVVLHSDTLEHVLDPLAGLRECHRILRSGGWCCFTIPIITQRLSRSRKGLPLSYHGQAAARKQDFAVHTEFGSDCWELVMEAGFDECRIVTAEFPAAQAIAARKP
jgi:SAM-dependent methyltransferase